MARLHILLFPLLLLFCVAPCRARRKLTFNTDSLLNAKRAKVYLHIDSNYVRRPLPRLILRVRSSFSGGIIHSSNTMTDGTKTKSKLSSNLNHTFSIGASYMGIALALSVNPSRMFGNSDLEYNIAGYGSRFGGELNYFHSTSYSGYSTIAGEKTDFPSNSFTQNMLTGSFYYVFSHSRFSYPAALTQTYIQVRSKGSWLLSLTLTAGNVRFHDNSSVDYITLHRNSIFLLGVGGGYAYNWVFPHNWLLHLSFTPTIAVWERFHATYDDDAQTSEEADDSSHWPGVILTARSSLIHNFGRKWFAGITLVSNTTLFDDNPYTVVYLKWRARITLGVRIW